jgi:hypothetical protein
VAETAGGRTFPPLGTKPRDDLRRRVFRRDRHARTAPQDLWPALLLAAALLFPIDVGIRRLMIEPAEARAYLIRGIERVRERLPSRARRRVEREEAFGRLLAAKEAAEERLTRRDEETAPASPAAPATASAAATAVLERTAAETTAPPEEERAPRVVWNRPIPGVTPRPEPPRPAADRPAAAPDAGAPASPDAAPASAPDASHTRRLLDARRRARKKE